MVGGMFLDNPRVRCVDSAKNLGVVLDTELTFNVQINKVVKICFSSLGKLF